MAMELLFRRRPRPHWMLSCGEWPIALFDRLYLRLHGLDRPESRVGPILRVAVRPSRVSARLASGAAIRRGDAVAVIHLDNERVASLGSAPAPPAALGLLLRRRLVESLAHLAALTDAGRALADVRACSATSIHHRGLRRLGFEPAVGASGGSALAGGYQRALLAILRPERGTIARGRSRAQTLWISRDALRSRYLAPALGTRDRR